MESAYADLRAHADTLAGGLHDIPRRAALHYGLWLDSARVYPFPLLAMHGALWGHRFFETTGRLGQAIRHRYFYDARERAARMAMLGAFADGFKALNRAVFVDTYANYTFAGRYGREPGAERVVRAPLLAALNRVHEAARRGADLGAAGRREAYEQALRWEQEVTVAPGVRAEVARFSCPVLRRLVLSPVVRFAYFPRGRFMVFRNFADPAERVRRGLAAFVLAERAGWEAVAESTRAYGVMPAAFEADRAGYAARLLAGAHPVAA